ncbi:MAG TPA: CinA family protein, partial [Bdellovibrionales bacterium]|nr:CinA family protein [Bdellovibrionales bacterium]
WFQGAVVSYARVVKRKVLNVPSTAFLAHGEVSSPVARAMARGALNALGSTWALSVTGIAGPGGGTKEKPVGTVYFAVVGPGLEESVRQEFKADDGRQDVQRQAALFAFEFLLNAMR